MVSIARQVAYDVLQKVEQGGYASDLLLDRAAALDSRDAGLATEIVFGCLRRQMQLDYLIAQFAPRRLDPEVRIALRMGAYQLRHLDRVPPHAAVSESVELVKRARKPSAAGLVNAVLRKIPPGDVKWPNRATELSTPAWLLDRWDRRFGPEITAGIATAFLQPSETYVASTGRIQDIGAQSIVPLLDITPGVTLLDLCAAPGNKTAQAIALGAKVTACDRHWHRLKAAHIPCPSVALDGTVSLPFRGSFDRILVDAPCTGTGTLGRNPEIKWNLKPSDVKELQRKQVTLVANALPYLKPGGLLVYSTCSLEDEENAQVVASFREICHIRTTKERIPGRDPGDGFFAAVLTSDKS